MVALNGALRAARRLADSFTPGPPSAKVSAISDRSPHHIHSHHQRQHGLFKARDVRRASSRSRRGGNTHRLDRQSLAQRPST